MATLILSALLLMSGVPISAGGRPDIKLSFDDVTGATVRYKAQAETAMSGPGEIHCSMFHSHGVARAGDHWQTLPHAGTIKFVGVEKPQLVQCRVTAIQKISTTAAR